MQMQMGGACLYALYLEGLASPDEMRYFLEREDALDAMARYVVDGGCNWGACVYAYGPGSPMVLVEEISTPVGLRSAIDAAGLLPADLEAAPGRLRAVFLSRRVPTSTTAATAICDFALPSAASAPCSA